MKPLKAILLTIVMGTIGSLLLVWSINGRIEGNGETYLREVNQFERKIKQRTDSLSLIPEDIFSADYYLDVKGELDFFYNNGDLGEGTLKNDSTYNGLSLSLFETYVSSFLRESFFIFDQLIVEQKDLKHIKDEAKEINSNKFYTNIKYENLSSFKIIQDIVSNYSEINDFTKKCDQFRFVDYELDTEFPSDRTTEWALESKELLETEYIQKVRSFKEALTGIPLMFYEKHVSYLNEKIKKHGNDFDEYYYQSSYIYTVLNPLERQIKALPPKPYEIEITADSTDSTDTINERNQLEVMLKDYAFKSVIIYMQKNHDNIRLPLLFEDEFVSDDRESLIKSKLKSFYFYVNRERISEVLHYFSFPVSRYYNNESSEISKDDLLKAYNSSYIFKYYNKEVIWDNLRCYRNGNGETVALVMGHQVHKTHTSYYSEKRMFFDKLTFNSEYKITSIYSIYR